MRILTGIFYVVIIGVLLLTSSPAEADDGPILQIGPSVGLNRSILTGPDDATGEPQFMSGAAFNGFGLAFGASVRAAIMPFLAVTADLLVSWDRATGYEERGDLRRELSMSTWRLRVPILLTGGWATNTWRVEAGVGPEIAIPLATSAELKERNIPVNQAFDLDVSGALSFGLAFGLSAAFRVSDSLWIPTTARFGWFPTVSSKSTGRFDGYVSPQQPGALFVEYDWTFVWTTGVMFDVVQ